MKPDLDRPDWHALAACAGEDLDLFFPQDATFPAEAKLICLSCPVRAECQDHGLHHEKHGIWGGLSEAERDQYRKALDIPLRPIWRESEELTDEIDLRSRGGGLQQPPWPKHSDSPVERSSDTGPDRELKGA